MFTLLPVILLFVSGIVILVVYQYREGLGVTWVIAVAGTFLAWISVLVTHWMKPSPFYVVGWNPVENYTNLIGFEFDLISWPYAFALATLAAAITLTSSAGQTFQIHPLVWAGNLIVAGAGLLTIMSATPLTMILSWTFIDICEIVLLQSSFHQIDKMRPIVYSFSVRVMGTFSLAAAMIISRSTGNILSFDQIIPQAGVFLFIGAALRLGVIPRHLPYPADFQFRREIGTMLRCVGPASALVLLARLPDDFLPGNWLGILKVIVTIAALYGGVMWLLSENELEGRPYWVIGIAGIAVFTILKGYQITSLVWGVILILIGGLISLYSARDPRIQYIPLLGILGFVGLPFTPAAGGWVGLINDPFNFYSVCYFLIHIMLIIGIARHLFKPGLDLSNKERWVQIIYPFGLLLPIIAHWIIATWGWPGSYSVGVWWASIVPIVTMGIGFYLFTQNQFLKSRRELLLNWYSVILRYVGIPLSNVFSLRWVFSFASGVYNLIQKAVNLVTILLEGEGGFLWVLLLLTLLITLITSGGIA